MKTLHRIAWVITLILVLGSVPFMFGVLEVMTFDKPCVAYWDSGVPIQYRCPDVVTGAGED